MNPLPVVVAELRRNWFGALAVVALVAIGVALATALSAQERALREASARAADRFDLVVGRPGSPTQLVLTTVYLQAAPLELLPADSLGLMQQMPGVAALAPVAVTDSFRGYPVVGTTADFATDHGRIAVTDGRRFTRIDEALVGSAVAVPLGQSLLPTHGAPAENIIESHDHAFSFTVVGRLAPTGTPWDRAILVPIEGVWAMHDEGRPTASGQAVALGPPWPDGQAGAVPAVVIKPKTVNDAYALRKSLRGHDSTAIFPAEVLIPLYALLGNVGGLVAALSFALDTLLLAAVTLVIAAVLAARRETMGALRALGAPPSYLFAAGWLYGLALVGAGVGIGFGAGALLAHALGAYVGGRAGFVIAASPGSREAALAAGLLAAGSLLAALPSLASLRAPVRRLLQGA